MSRSCLHKNNTILPLDATAPYPCRPIPDTTLSERNMPRARARKLEKKRKRATVKTEPLADGAGASSAAGAGRAGARAGAGDVSKNKQRKCCRVKLSFLSFSRSQIQSVMP